MTLELHSLNAIADFVDHIAELIREGVVEAVSLEMRKDESGKSVNGRASVLFTTGSDHRMKDLDSFAAKPIPPLPGVDDEG